MDAVLTLARLVLAGVFAFAGIAKLRDGHGTRRSLLQFGVPARLVAVSAGALPVAELAVAMALVPASTAYAGAIAAAVLLSVFIAAIAANLLLGRKPDCNCFGQRRSTPVSRRTLARNGVLLTIAALLAAGGPAGQGSAITTFASGLPPLTLAGTAAALVVGLLVVQNMLLLRVKRQNDVLIEHFSADRARRAAAPPSAGEASLRERGSLADVLAGLPIGTPAPDFSLESLDGSTVTLRDLLAGARPLLLFFADSNCGPCRALLPDIAIWQRAHADTFELAVVSRGTIAANREKFGGLAGLRVLVQEGRDVSARYSAFGTPSAVLVKTDGTIGSRMANAEAEIRRLLRQVVTPAATDSETPSDDASGLAPAFTLDALDGGPVTHETLSGRATLFFFHGSGCGLCDRLLPDLKAWAAGASADEARLVVVSDAGIDKCRALELPAAATVLLDPDASMRKRYGLVGTPSAALVDAGGYLVRKTSGRAKILRLVGTSRSAVSEPVRPHLPVGAAPRKDPCVTDELMSDGSMVLYNSCRNRMSTLNGTAAFVWESCDGFHTIENIAAELGEIFPGGEDIEGGVREALEGFLRDGMIVVSAPSPEAAPSL